MKKIILTAFAALMALAVFTGCEYNNVDYSQIEEKTYTGDTLIEFLGGIGTKDPEGNVEITPNGWGTSSNLKNPIKSGETLLAFSVEFKVPENYQGTLQFMADWNKTCNIAVSSQNKDFTKIDVDLSKITADLKIIQPFIQNTSDWSETTDQKIVVKSIYIKQKIN